ncbi:hypothetical protein H072_5122 [Dactylellina haptotyla CBS 200.50]|uniref:Uncharacterized protein n=1 Tax=Dactylellina haptotyla (strain CBS 200.50) TaxID=1284197 RepID=S8C074_DACHA|nr:hypothetical protein H072_5122 [Dactylellina haptotyla CBS 200.50]
MSDIINANPTILNASDLPTRLSESRKKQSSSAYIADSISRLPTSKTLLHDPFAPSPGGDSAYSSGASDQDDDEDESAAEDIDEQEIYDLISSISDPEHPLSLGELAVINLPHIHVTHGTPTPSNPHPMSHVLVEITPTINHCSLATVIGLGVRVRLEQALPTRFRIDVKIREGTHQSTDQVNKQLNDKERVAAACENETLMGVLSNMLATCK